MNEYAGMMYTTHQQMVEAMVWDWLSSNGRNAADAKSALRDVADGGDGLAAEFMASGWLGDREDVGLGCVIDAIVELQSQHA